MCNDPFRRTIVGRAYTRNDVIKQGEIQMIDMPPAIEIAQAREIRIDTYDKKSNRTGYIVIDPKTGRLDQFDTRGNRTGYGTTTTPRPDPRDSDRNAPDKKGDTRQ
jgi:hypothetical protein